MISASLAPPVPLLALELTVAVEVDEDTVLVDEELSVDVVDAFVVELAIAPVVEDLPPVPLDVSPLEHARTDPIAINAKDFFIDSSSRRRDL